jgi:hypothetical protein
VFLHVPYFVVKCSGDYKDKHYWYESNLEGKAAEAALLLLLNRATRQGELVLAVASMSGDADLLFSHVSTSVAIPNYW